VDQRGQEVLGKDAALERGEVADGLPDQPVLLGAEPGPGLGRDVGEAADVVVADLVGPEGWRTVMWMPRSGNPGERLAWRKAGS
jgi:hypothetical protein